MTREQDAAKAADIERWIDAVVSTHAILPMDATAFRRCAKLMHRRSEDNFEDAMIASTALIYSLTVVTRNVRDFANFDVPILNPFVAGTP